MAIGDAEYGYVCRTTDGRLALRPTVAVTATDQYCLPYRTTDGRIALCRADPCNVTDQYGIPVRTTDGKIGLLETGTLPCNPVAGIPYQDFFDRSDEDPLLDDCRWTVVKTGDWATDFALVSLKAHADLDANLTQTSIRYAIVDSDSAAHRVDVDTSLVWGTLSSGTLRSRLVARYTDINNYYVLNMSWHIAGDPNSYTGLLEKVVAGVVTELDRIQGNTDLGEEHIALSVNGTTLKAGFTDGATPPVATWSLTATDGALTTGNSCGIGMIMLTGESDGTEGASVKFDHFKVTAP